MERISQERRQSPDRKGDAKIQIRDDDIGPEEDDEAIDEVIDQPGPGVDPRGGETGFEVGNADFFVDRGKGLFLAFRQAIGLD